jgi:hypothetical protein
MGITYSRTYAHTIVTHIPALQVTVKEVIGDILSTWKLHPVQDLHPFVDHPSSFRFPDKTLSRGNCPPRGGGVKRRRVGQGGLHSEL